MEAIWTTWEQFIRKLGNLTGRGSGQHFPQCIALWAPYIDTEEPALSLRELRCLSRLLSLGLFR